MSQASVDFDVHGIVGIRLEDALPEDIAAVIRQIGSFQVSRLKRTPEINIRFVSSLPTHNLTFIRYPFTGFNDEGFFLLDPDTHEPRARVDFSAIGSECKILCRHRAGAVPFLMGLVILSALKRGMVPLHGSAFVHNGVGVIVTGWAKGGKTEALLAFAQHGSRYVGDEWILLAPDGGRVYGIPEQIRIWEWHMKNVHHLQRYVGRHERLRFKLIHLCESLISHMPLTHKAVSPSLQKALPVLRRQLYVKLTPDQIFSARSGLSPATPRRLFWMCSWQRADIEVVEADASEIAQRMTASVSYEQLPLMSAYLEFLYAFPGLKNRFLEDAADLQRELLTRALVKMDAYVVRHPYPVRFEKLYCAMSPFVKSEAAESILA